MKKRKRNLYNNSEKEITIKMKNKALIPIVALSLITMSSLPLIGKEEYKPVIAYTPSGLPTTIKLNDTEPGAIRNYYSNLNSLSDSEKTGTNLLKNLKPILKNNQKYYTYDSTSGKNNIWRMYEITDRDWEKSPASSTVYGTYDAASNTITNYQYGESNSDGKNNPYIHALYINRNVDNQTKAWGNHNQDEWGINQEHIWAKSNGFEDAGAGGARGDPMHLWAGNGNTNREHNNEFFGNVDKSKTYKDMGSKYSNQSGNYVGTSLTNGTSKVFEPQDSDKGDIARAVFYMVARYNDLAGTETTISGDEPNLELVDTGSAPNMGYQSSKPVTGKMGLLSDLLEWNRLDPPDEYEIHRNNLLFENYTNNRNPFIDFPQWADLIWGENAGTHYANPLTDSINDNALSVSASTVSIIIGESKKVSASTIDSSNITWTISDSSIAELSKTTSSSGEEITIKALKTGECKITVTATVDSELITKEIKVNVTEKPKSLLDLPWYYFVIGGGVLLLIVIVIVVIYSKGSKKTKKTIKKAVKSVTKSSSSKSSSSGKKKSSSSNKKKK